MSYYTEYTIKIQATNPDSNMENAGEGLKGAIRKIFQVSNSDFVMDDCGDYSYFIGPSKWYNCMDDMIKLSQEYPDVCFVVEGNGEVADDYWKSYFYRGREQVGSLNVDIPFNIQEDKERPYYKTCLEGAVQCLKNAGYGETSDVVMLIRQMATRNFGTRMN